MTGFETLIENSEKFQNIKNRCIDSVKLSLTGITNLVVNHEDPCIVDSFLQAAFQSKELYKGTTKIDAIELQQDSSGQGMAISYIDQLIYGSFETQTGSDPDDIDVKYKMDGRTGERKRKSDGFINRAEVLTKVAANKLLVIRNIDYCNDFCGVKPATVD